MKSLSNAVIINGVSYTINATEAKKVAQLLGIKPNTNTTVVEPKKAESKAEPKQSAPKKTTLVVGSLEQDGVYVRTIKDKFINSKARYAIKMSATDMGAKKLGKGDKVYDALAKEDKYVQVYKFKTVADADKFMADQESRLTKQSTVLGTTLNCLDVKYLKLKFQEVDFYENL